ncbi:hypothetical protein J41TS12_47030 [Paenibacillus antibioticophila]|uniref:Uncharacterized protein n=2 Tax=Paenibacillus antibioticophila TaxID=1274374 RepID=A0A919XVF2_9BACL|nr:hypothetical protein J41TS12_47030 [Paenibacillus antibioticophila]
MLFPKTLDFYQIELTRMLETERYGEAADLLRFLLQCQGQEERLYDEWRALLNWLIDAFPNLQGEAAEQSRTEDEGEEEMARRHLEAKMAEDGQYAEKLLNTVIKKPLSEQTLLALDQLAYLDKPEVDEALIDWLEHQELHPLLQFRALQILRRRGTSGIVTLSRSGERVEIELDFVPLNPEDFPGPIHAVLDRIADHAQVQNPTLFYFSQELWSQFIMAMYGTKDYISLLNEEDDFIDIWAAALHKTVSESVPANLDEQEIRSMYSITDSLRLRYEQAYRSIRQFVAGGLRG